MSALKGKADISVKSAIGQARTLAERLKTTNLYELEATFNP